MVLHISFLIIFLKVLLCLPCPGSASFVHLVFCGQATRPTICTLFKNFEVNCCCYYKQKKYIYIYICMIWLLLFSSKSHYLLCTDRLSASAIALLNWSRRSSFFRPMNWIEHYVLTSLDIYFVCMHLLLVYFNTNITVSWT